MNAPEQLTMFEPDASEASRLVERHMSDSDKFGKLADKAETLRIPGLVGVYDRHMEASGSQAFAMACYVDLLALEGDL